MQVFIKKGVLENLIARKNLSQNEIAKAIGVGEQHFVMIKDKDKYSVGVSPKVRRKLLKYFKAEFDELFYVET